MAKKARIFTVLLLGLVLMAFLAHAAAEESGYARNLQPQCTLNASTGEKLRRVFNQEARSPFETSKKKEAFIELRCTEPMHALYIQWYDTPEPWILQTLENEQWVDVGEYGLEGFAQEVVQLDGYTDIRLVRRAEKGKATLSVFEITPYSEGELPPEVHQWKKAEKADLLIISAHPDDEYIFLGGMIPTYAGQRQMEVQVAYLTYARPLRLEELLNGLWTCGVRNYPVVEVRKDFRTTSMRKVYGVWGKEELQKYFIALVRKYQPKVIVSQDIDGEYGHGAHKVAADISMFVYDNAGNANVFPDCGAPWQPYKLYLHLYGEGQRSFDWNIPLEYFGGKTALEIARDAWHCHISQQGGSVKDTKNREFRFTVRNGGYYDNAVFGLYGSTVGEDVELDDIFENVPMD